MRDVNSLSPNRLFDVALRSIILCLAVIVQISCMALVFNYYTGSLPRERALHIFLVGCFAAVFVMCYALFLTADIHRRVLSLSGVSARGADFVKIIFLSLAMFLSLPYLQSKVNSLLMKQARM